MQNHVIGTFNSTLTFCIPVLAIFNTTSCSSFKHEEKGHRLGRSSGKHNPANSQTRPHKGVSKSFLPTGVYLRSLSDHFPQQIKRKELAATRKKHQKPSAEEAHTYTQINTASDCLQQTKSPADHGASITHSQCILGRTVTSQDAIYKQFTSMPKEAQHVGVR